MTATPDSHDTTVTRHTIRDGIDDARAKAAEVAQAALERTRDGIDQARDKAGEAYAAAREKARAAGRTANDGLDSNPIVALIGGLALGVVVGALLPRTERETQVLGTVGDKLQSAAREAADAAKDAGRDKLAELGLSREQARDTMRTLLDHFIAAAGTAGSAALESARKNAK